MVEHIKLTQCERDILTSYRLMLDGLADYIGPGYEIILHSLENFDNSVIKVINGHYSGRSEGAPLTDLALQMLDAIEANPANAKGIIYKNRTPGGAPLRSTTIPIHGENERIIGLLCINFHMNTPLATLLDHLTKVPTPASDRIETYANNIEELVLSALLEAKEQVLTNPNISAANRNKEIIAILKQKSIFNLKDGVVLVAKHMGISKNTVYLHLRNLE